PWLDLIHARTKVQAAQARAPVPTRSDRSRCRGGWIGQWHSVSSGSEGVEPEFPAQRPSCRERGPAAILVDVGGGGSRGRAGTFIADEEFLVAQEVHALDIDGRISPVPQHGYCTVTWKSERYDMFASRPVIKALGQNGEVLTELRPGEYVDTASLASATE